MSEAALDHARPSGDDDPVLEVHDLHVSFEGRVGLGAGVAGKKAAVARAVDGVDLTLRRGEVLALAGESGCERRRWRARSWESNDRSSGRSASRASPGQTHEAAP